MKHLQTWSKAWSLLSSSARRQAIGVLLTVIVVGMLSAAMVGSVLPFLAVLADRSAIASTPILLNLFEFLGFTGEEEFVVALGVGSLSVILIAMAGQILRSFAVSLFCAKQAESLEIRLFNTYMNQPYLFFLDQHTGNLQTRLLSLCRQIVDHFYRPAAEILAAGFSVLAILCLMFWIAPVISVFTLLFWGGFYSLTYAATREWVAHHARQFLLADQARFRIANEGLGGIKAIKISGKESSFVDRFRNPAHDASQAQAITDIASEIPNYVLQGIAYGGIIIIALVLTIFWGSNSEGSLGSILPILGFVAFAGQRLLPELQKIYASFTTMQHGHVTVAALYRDLIELRPVLPNKLMPSERIDFSRQLDFENVHFTYPKARKPGLRDVSFRIHAGERIGIVGSTGSGKSTLADVLLGLIAPDCGSIVIDDTQIEPDNMRAWQNEIGYVPQDIFLVDGTIKENIAFGCLPDEIDENRIKTAYDIAQLRKFIEDDLPDGIDTLVGERGVKLSGGQRQRIGIARAIYRDVSILIFDEATSALDPVTEQEVMSSIDAIPGKFTIALITHRLATIAKCDRIFVLEEGELVAIGSWESLLKTSPIFCKLVTANEERGTV